MFGDTAAAALFCFVALTSWKHEKPNLKQTKAVSK
jgi:hypothetical protein